MADRRRELTIATGALLTAVIALAVAIWQASETRLHNRLSAQPGITFLVTETCAQDFAGIQLVNGGPGSAVLQPPSLFLDGILEGRAGSVSWRSILQEVGIDPGSDWLIFFSVDYGDLWPAGLARPLLAVPRDHCTSERLTRLLQAIRRIDIAVCYCSVYRDCWTNSLKGEVREGCEMGAVHERPSSLLRDSTQNLPARAKY